MGQAELTYDEFFQLALDKFDVSSPAELSDDKRKEFFNYIDDNWEAKDESIMNAKELIESNKNSQEIVDTIIKEISYLDTLGRGEELSLDDARKVAKEVFGTSNFKEHIMFEDDSYDQVSDMLRNKYGKPKGGKWNTVYSHNQFSIHVSNDKKYIKASILHGGPQVIGAIFEK